MAAVTDYADAAAAVTGGWKKLQIDRGAAYSERYVTHFEKPVTGCRTRRQQDGGDRYLNRLRRRR
jgi:hypothetical protein